MIILSSLMVFLFGISIGSFLNVVIDRIPRGESIFHGRSHCDACKKSLSWYDLIPLLSYVLLRGKCRYCNDKIPARLFLIELLTGFIFTFIYLDRIASSAHSIDTVYILVVTAIFVAIFFIDLQHGIIPDILTALFFLITLFLLLIFHRDLFLTHLLAGLLSLSFFLLLFIGTGGRGMGFGDVKLSFPLGLFLGLSGIFVAFYLSFLSGAIVSLLLIAWKKKKFRHDTIPFGPFLVASSLVSYLWSEKILQLFPHFFN